MAASAAAAAQRNDSRHRAIRATVIAALGPRVAGRIRWSSSTVPTIDNVEILASWDRFPRTRRRWLLHDDSTATPLERSDGMWRPAVAALEVEVPCRSLADLAEAFDQFLAPSRVQPGTRAKYWRVWKLCLTWAVAWDALTALIPMTTATLKALIWDLVRLGCAACFLKDVLCAVQHRHSKFQVSPPIVGRGEFAAWTRCFGSIMGTPLRLKLPIHRDTVAALLGARPTSLTMNSLPLLARLLVCSPLRNRRPPSL